MKNVLEYLERTADRMPDQIAAIDERGSITYACLLDSARRVGTALIRRGEGANRPIPVLMEKGIGALQAFLGIVYSGNFYVLLNPELPLPRLGQIVTTLSPEFILTDEAHLPLANELDSRTVLLSELLQTEGEEGALARVRGRMTDTDPLYANFTSGSTGTPKGVLVGHRSVIDFIDQFTALFGIDSSDVIGNQAPFDFDVSVKDIYSALKTGATLVMIPKSLFLKPAELLDFICEHQVTTMIWAVSALCLICAFHGLDYRVPASVKRILFSGEVMPLKHLNTWMEKLPEAEFVNLYGPTEITCNCTYYRIPRDRDNSTGLPIGIPFPNEKVFLLDEQDGVITAPNRPGEICVGGSCLAIGYYGDPEQTARRFTQNPANRDYYERIYRTGDLGYYDESGNLFFSGRKDFQIKYMGHRIELEEIEQVLMAQEGVEQACCVFDEKKGRLYAAFTGGAETNRLHEALSARLPVYMVPRKIMKLEAMPLTKNGKTDRKEVLNMAVSRRGV